MTSVYSSLRSGLFGVLCLAGPVHGDVAVEGKSLAAAKAAKSAASMPAESAPPYISPEILLGHVYYLASDELAGRGVGSPGIERAARYIADQFASVGIEPGGEDGTYFQNLDVNQAAELGDETELFVEGIELEPPALDTDYRPFAWSTSETFDGDVVFVGYGLVGAERGYDDYDGVEVTGKVVLMLRREPPSWSVGGGYSEAARFDHKVAVAKEHGAAAVLIANQKPEEEAQDRLMPFFRSAARHDYGLPAFHITRTLGDKLLAAGGLDLLEVMQERLDLEDPTHCSADLAGVRVRGRADIRRERTASRNVIGLIRGTGPQRDEYVVVGAHYDHLGRQARRSFFGGAGSGNEEIHNGADDNASGTAGVIELGKALARAGNLNRSVLLMAFTAEELGLVGSAHFVAHPTVPLERVAAMVNMDMIGRMPEDHARVTVYGVGTGDGFEELVSSCAATVGLEIDARAAVSGQSDEASFYDGGIPSVFFFSGLHADYHQPGDDAEKLNEQGAAQVVRLAYGVTRELVDRPSRPTYCYVPGGAGLSDQPGRAVLGFWPGPSVDGGPAGVVVERTAPNGPADRAGIRAGDRIVQLDGQPISNRKEYMAITADQHPGESADVIVERDGERVTLTVTFAAG